MSPSGWATWGMTFDASRLFDKGWLQDVANVRMRNLRRREINDETGDRLHWGMFRVCFFGGTELAKKIPEKQKYNSFRVFGFARVKHGGMVVF